MVTEPTGSRRVTPSKAIIAADDRNGVAVSRRGEADDDLCPFRYVALGSGRIPDAGRECHRTARRPLAVSEAPGVVFKGPLSSVDSSTGPGRQAVQVPPVRDEDFPPRPGLLTRLPLSIERYRGSGDAGTSSITRTRHGLVPPAEIERAPPDTAAP
jgi:hypothetical protein